MEATNRLALPLLSAGQAQKELVHNEAIQILDVLVGGAVEELPIDTPPASPTIGSSYLVGVAPTGAWASHGGKIAAYTAGGWRLITPADGVTLFVKSAQRFATYRAGTWEIGVLRASAVLVGGEQVLSTRAAAIEDPSGGTQADAEARAAVSAILAVLRHHGLITV